MAGESYRYRAFISYRHTPRDRKWARWLIEKLETYRTPRALVKAGVPSHVGHLYRDDDEVPASSDLSHQIEDSLRASQFLIVVCSPDTPKSKWVRKEIDYFRSIGRGDRILALLVAGEPSESFPENLLYVPTPRDGSAVELIESEPIAADVRPRDDEKRSVTERRAFLRLAAGLLGVGYDDLVQREQQRRARRRKAWTAVAAAAAVAALYGAYKYWDYNTLHTRYYANYTLRWGVPSGVDELDAQTASSRAVSFAIDTLHGRVVSMRRLDGYGNLTTDFQTNWDEWDKGVAKWDFDYEGSQVSSVALSDPSKAIVLVEKYEWERDRAFVSFRRAAGLIANLGAQYNALSPNDQIGASTVSQMELHFTRDGLVEKCYFQTAYRTPARESDGSSGREYRYTASGLVRSTTALADKFSPISNGTQRFEMQYSPLQDLVSLAEYDSQGRRQGLVSIERDAIGNPAAYVVDGPGVGSDLDMSGASRQTYVLNGHGAYTESRFFDKAGKPTWNDSGISVVVGEYDEKGRRTSIAFFGTNGRPTINTEGFAKTTFEFDDAGNFTRQSYFGIDGRPVVEFNGCASWTTEYDSEEHVVGQTCFGPDGRMRASRKGDAHFVQSYNERNLVDRMAFFGADGKPASGGDLGCKRETLEYDDRGNIELETCVDAQGKPEAGWFGIASVRTICDDAGEMKEQATYGPNGDYVSNGTGYAVWKRTYNTEGRNTINEYYDAQMKPTKGEDGYFKIVNVYNKYGDLVEARVFGTDGNPTTVKDGWSRFTQKFDYPNKRYEMRWFSTTGMLFRTADVDLEDNGRVMRSVNIGADGQPVPDQTNCTANVSRFSWMNVQTEQICLDEHGNEVADSTGVAHSIAVLDSRGRVQETRYYKPNTLLGLLRRRDKEVPTPGPLGCPVEALGRNTLGLVEDWRCQTPSGNLQPNKWGVARTHSTYDNRGLAVAAEFFGTHGEPVTSTTQVHRTETSYDPWGNPVAIRYFDGQGNLLDTADPTKAPPAGTPAQ